MSGTSGSTPTRPSVRRSATDLVYEHLRGEILGDTQAETRFLTEEAVAAALGVSRTPVREAFLRLAADGLLTLVPRKGAVVVPVTEREMREVMETRAVIESWSAARVAGDAPARERLVETLRDHQQELRALGTQADPARFIEVDRAFHRELVAATGNAVMLDLYERLRDQQLRMGVRAVAGHPERMEAVRDEHDAIVEALAAGDPDAARATVVRHLDASADNLLGPERA